MGVGWIDISVPLQAGVVTWPGDDAVCVESVARIDSGDTCNLSRLSMSTHAGTHIDAPLHYVGNGVGIDQMPIDATVGAARVLHVGDGPTITADALEPLEIRAGQRLLFRTRNSSRPWWSHAFDEDFVYLSLDAAEFLAEKRVRAVGIDYLSVGGYSADARGDEVHRTLLRAGIWLIEGLNLTQVSPGDYELMCLPLGLVGAEGAPARAILRKTHE